MSSSSSPLPSDGHLMVHVRIRPMPSEDATRRPCIEAINSCTVSAAVAPNRFEQLSFDAVASSSTPQAEIFDSVARSICDACLEGYNGTIFAYGQTGSGKTWTMQGSNTPGAEGLIPRAFEYLFSRFSSEFIYKIKCSYVEIYNEMIFDLLSDGGNRQLQLREDSKRGIVFVEGATEELLKTPQEALQVFWRGCSNRTVAATMLNRESSRSHSVFTLFITSERQGGDAVSGLKDIRTSRFNLVDLAGSERQAATQTMGLRLKEAGNINRSLLALANVINALALADSRHAPYRDSKLTFLLRDSLGGNSKTAVIATVSPAASCQGETLSTLRFAQRAKLVQNRPTLNQDVWGTLPELQAEIIRLRDLLRNQKQPSEPNFEMKPVIVEYEFNALSFALKQQQKANDCIRMLQEQIQPAGSERSEDVEVGRLRARVEELEEMAQVQTCLDYKLYAEELARKLAAEQPPEVPMQPIITSNSDELIKEAVDAAKSALNAEHQRELSEVQERFAAERMTFSKKISELEHRVKQLQAENEHRMEMFQMELEMERKSAERMAAENAILKSKASGSDEVEALKKAMEEQSRVIEGLQRELQSLQKQDVQQQEVQQQDANRKKDSHLEERIQFLTFSLHNAQTDNEHLIAKHAAELSHLRSFVEEQRTEIEHLKAENDKLMQHNNFKQKLQYHVKIKQENNELREEVARLQALLAGGANKP